MLEWINNNGLAALAIYFVIISVLGTMPDPGPNASYGARWGFSAAQAFCGNLKTLKASITKNGNGTKE